MSFASYNSIYLNDTYAEGYTTKRLDGDDPFRMVFKSANDCYKWLLIYKKKDKGDDFKYRAVYVDE